MNNRPYSFHVGPGRRTTAFTNTERDEIEMRPLTSNEYPSNRCNKSSPMSSNVQQFIDRLKSNKPWNDRFKFAKKEKRIGRSQFAVNIPTKWIIHLIVIFFLIPLSLGFFFLIRALFFGLKEDDAHPLHKKLPKSHLRSDQSDGSSENIIEGGEVEQYNSIIDNSLHGSFNQTLFNANNSQADQSIEIPIMNNDPSNSSIPLVNLPEIHQTVETPNITSNSGLV